MDDTLISRLRQWLTPERPMAILDTRPLPLIMAANFRLYVLAVDGLSRGLLDASTRQEHYERLRDRLFPNLCFRVDPRDVDELGHGGSELWLTPDASERWLQQARRSRQDVEFSFLYSPFAIVRGHQCLSGGWVVPPSSRSPFPYPRLHLSFGVRRLALRVVAGQAISGSASDDPASALLAARAEATSP